MSEKAKELDQELVSNLFVDLFSPKNINSFIFPKRIKEKFKDEALYGNLLFYGSPGIGKSALAKYLAKKHYYKFINVSQEGKIDLLRSELDQFCAMTPLHDEDLDNSVKVVWLDEIDGSKSDAFYDALRGFMNQYSETVRFVATCNYFEKVPLAIKSRFECINFNCLDSEEEQYVHKYFVARLKAIVTKRMQSTITDDALEHLVSIHFPDWRGALQALQSIYISRVDNITIDNIKKESYEFRELYELLIKGGSAEDIHYTLMGEYSNSARLVLESLDANFVNYLKDNHPKYLIGIPYFTVHIADYMYKAIMGIDPSIAMRACCYKIMETCKKIKGDG